MCVCLYIQLSVHRNHNTTIKVLGTKIKPKLTVTCGFVECLHHFVLINNFFTDHDGGSNHQGILHGMINKG